MSTRLAWSPAQVTLAAQASKVLSVINQMNYKCDFSFECACDIFNKCAVPILAYGSKIWGSDVYHSIEDGHIKFCKKQLGVGSKAPTPAVLGDDGRDRLYNHCYIKFVKYWLKVIFFTYGLVSEILLFISV